MQVTIDLCDRPWRTLRGSSIASRWGACPLSSCRIFRSLAIALGSAVHIRVTGENAHHMIRGVLQGVGRALRQALRLESGAYPAPKGFCSVDVAIIDSGGANWASVQFALERLGARSVITSKVRVIGLAPLVILPGVGAASYAMGQLLTTGVAASPSFITAAGAGDLLRHATAVLMVRGGRSAVSWDSAAGHQALITTRVTSDSSYGLECAQHRPKRIRCSKGSIPKARIAISRTASAVGCGEFTLASVDYGIGLSAVVRKRTSGVRSYHQERSRKAGARLLDNFLKLP